jgi:hypothetical protein
MAALLLPVASSQLLLQETCYEVPGFPNSLSQVRAVPERIKDKVLEWALALERAGVTGDGMTFSVKDKEIAQTVTFNIYGSQIGQLSNLGTNLKTGE